MREEVREIALTLSEIRDSVPTPGPGENEQFVGVPVKWLEKLSRNLETQSKALLSLPPECDQFTVDRLAIIAQRESCYGSVHYSSKCLADGWSALLRSYVSGGGKIKDMPAWFATLMECWLKLNRIAFDPTEKDSWADALNYLDLARVAYTKTNGQWPNKEKTDESD